MLIENKTEIIPSQASQELEGVTTINKGLIKRDFIYLGQVSPKQLAVQVLLGTVLGDGHIERVSYNKACLSLTQSFKQVDYLLWKVKALVPLVGQFKYYFNCNGRNNGRSYSIIMRALSSSYVKHVFDDYYTYINGGWVKIVKMNVLRRLNPMGLMVWYCDDGYIPDRRAGRSVALSTCSFSIEENDLMCKYFLDSWKVKFEINEKGLYYYLVAYGDMATRFIDLISKYVPKCMEYKVNPLLSARHGNYNREDIVCTLEQSKELFRNEQSSKPKLIGASDNQLKEFALYINNKGLSVSYETSHLRKSSQLKVQIYDTNIEELTKFKLYFGGCVKRASSGYGAYYVIGNDRAKSMISLLFSYFSVGIIDYLKQKCVIEWWV